jgi:hypothetical protein
MKFRKEAEGFGAEHLGVATLDRAVDLDTAPVSFLGTGN